MTLSKPLKEKIYESVTSVLPITAIVLLLSITIAPLPPDSFMLFLFGAVLLVFGMGFFTLGAEMSMIPMGEGIGVHLSRSKSIILSLSACFILGALITAAEPDLQVLANQVPSIPNPVLIFTVAAGVGLFLLISQFRILFRIRLSHALIVFYLFVFILAFSSPGTFIPVSFDAGGVTTGPITVPFIMALGIGMASIRSDKDSSNDSFGLISLCSIGPILSVLLLGLFYKPSSVLTSTAETIPGGLNTTQAAAMKFLEAIPGYMKEIAAALLPIILLFAVFQLVFRRFHGHQIHRIIAGLFYTYIGLVLFLTGANVGFVPAGQFIGSTLASSPHRWLLVPIGMVIGFFIVKAEPAVQILTKQVEEISNGAIPRTAIARSLSIGIALSVGLAMLRILTGISILWFLVPGYLISLILTFFVPQIFTGIAFDSGGVASGPMTATFLLPLAMGACGAVGGDIMTDAFGIVAMVAMTPLCTIQLLGIHSQVKKRRTAAEDSIETIPSGPAHDFIVYFDTEPREEA